LNKLFNIYRNNSNEVSFWEFNLLGWFIYASILFFGVYVLREATIENKINFFIKIAFGILLTGLVNLFYLKINLNKINLIALTILLFITSILVGLIWNSVFYFIVITLIGNKDFLENLTVIFIRNIYNIVFWDIMWIFVWSGFYFTMKLWYFWSEQRSRTEKSNLLAETAKLQLLSYQLNPHFLFNSLNSIRALISENKENAKIMITELSEFLQYSLVTKDNINISFAKEIESIKYYLSIEKKRFEDKLEIEYDLDPSILDIIVLSFLIHPIIENAIKYGMKTSKLPLRIKIKARMEQQALIISVINSGKWFKWNENDNDLFKSTGIGLENVRSRLENAYKDNHSLEIFEKDETVEVRITIYNNKKEIYEEAI